jgi:hypothetical protein
MFRLLLPLLLLCQLASAQKLKKVDKQIVQYLQQQVGYLSSDALKGRRAGDQGEVLAAEFIASKFKEIGITPHGDNGTFFQHFTINDGKEIAKEKKTSLSSTLKVLAVILGLVLLIVLLLRANKKIGL